MLPSELPAEASAVIGGTPIVGLRRLTEGLGAEVVAKLEYLNPGGSVKDRIGRGDDRGRGRVAASSSPGGVIVEPTSGNTGIALAMVCAARGYGLILTLPEGMSRERTKLLRCLRGRGPRDAVARGDGGGDRPRASEIVAEREAPSCRSSSPTRRTRRSIAGRPPRRSGATSTARWTRCVAGVGTGGTITGVGQVLKERRPDGPGDRGRAGRLAGPLRRPRRARTRSRGSAPGSSPRCSTAR